MGFGFILDWDFFYWEFFFWFVESEEDIIDHDTVEFPVYPPTQGSVNGEDGSRTVHSEVPAWQKVDPRLSLPLHLDIGPVS